MNVSLNHPKIAESLSGLTGDRWLGQRKLDGVRLAVVYGPDGRPSHGLTKGGHQVAAPQGLPDMPAGTVVDGELVSTGWQAALSELAAGRPGRWAPFDLAAYPDPLGGLLARLDLLQRVGFETVETGPVEVIWERVLYDGGEGIVVKSADGPYSSPSFKIKPPRRFFAIAHRGFLLLLDDAGRPKSVGKCPDSATGRVLVACEGATSHGKVRAPRILSTASANADVSTRQLERLTLP